jgi:uncharacterized protein with PIN domain
MSMILECACGKLFRVSDRTSQPPSKCDACGGSLRPVGGTPPPADAPARVAMSAEGEVRCPTCGDHFRVESPQPKEKPRPAGPACPNCGAVLSIDSVPSEISGIGWVGQEKMWYCPRCMTVLGFTAWKR